MRDAVSVAVSALDRSGPSGALWSLPRGTSRVIAAGDGEALLYVTVHRARAGLGIRR